MPANHANEREFSNHLIAFAWISVIRGLLSEIRNCLSRSFLLHAEANRVASPLLSALMKMLCSLVVAVFAL
jgi:hypothetical protein